MGQDYKFTLAAMNFLEYAQLMIKISKQDEVVA